MCSPAIAGAVWRRPLSSAAAIDSMETATVSSGAVAGAARCRRRGVSRCCCRSPLVLLVAVAAVPDASPLAALPAALAPSVGSG